MVMFRMHYGGLSSSSEAQDEIWVTASIKQYSFVIRGSVTSDMANPVLLGKPSSFWELNGLVGLL